MMKIYIFTVSRGLGVFSMEFFNWFDREISEILGKLGGKIIGFGVVPVIFSQMGKFGFFSRFFFLS